jgi:hypothetical protein
MKTVQLTAAVLGLMLSGASPALTAEAARAKPTTTTATTVIQPEALQAMRRMSAYLATLPSFELTSRTSQDVVTRLGERVQLDGVVHYKARRPDGFVIEVDSDRKKRTFYYDGKQFTVYAPDLGFYATAPAPPTIRQTLQMVEAKYGVELPLEDLFRWNDPIASPVENLTAGFVVGPDTVDGVAADQYAFRQSKVDWQIWIQRGAQPLPLKIVIVDQVDPVNPAYVAQLSWNVTAPLSADDFTFHPAKDAKLIRMSEVAQ